jgi:hypothetical protein
MPTFDNSDSNEGNTFWAISIVVKLFRQSLKPCHLTFLDKTLMCFLESSESTQDDSLGKPELDLIVKLSCQGYIAERLSLVFLQNGALQQTVNMHVVFLEYFLVV